MPKNKTQQKTQDKELQQTLKQLTNQYVVYERRLGERIVLSPEERKQKLKEFFELYSEELDKVLFRVADLAAKAYEPGNEGNSWGVEQLTKTQRHVLEQFVNYKTGKNLDDTDNIQEVTTMLGEFAMREMKKKTKFGQTFEKSESEAVSDKAKKGNRDILKWLYKHAEQRTAVAEGTQQKGNKSYMPFIEAIASRPASQQAKIFYLVCVNHTKQCTDKDIEDALTKGPNLDDFRKHMNKSKWKFWARIAGNKIYWERLSNAVVLIDEKLSHGQGFAEIKADDAVPQAKQVAAQEQAEEIIIINENDKKNNDDKAQLNESSLDVEDQPLKELNKSEVKENKEEEGKQQEAGGDAEKGKKDEPERVVKPFFDEKAANELRSWQNVLENAKGANLPKKEKEKVYKLVKKKIADLLSKQKRLIDESVGVEDPNSWILDMGTYAGSVATTLNNAPVMDVAMGIAIAADAAAIGTKIAYMVKNYKHLNKTEVSRQVAFIGQTCITLSADIAKTVELVKFVKGGMTVAQAGEAVSTGAMSTASNALSLAKGVLTMTKGIMQTKEASKIQTGSYKAEDRLKRVDSQKMQGDDALYANDLTKYGISIAKCRASKGAYNAVNGAMSTISGILNLTGLGSLLGIPITISSYILMAVGWLAKTIAHKKQNKRVLDRFFGIDKAIQVYKDRLVSARAEINAKKKKGEKEEEAIELGFLGEQLLRAELREYGEALLGVTSDGAAINLIQTRYAEYLYDKVFVKSQEFKNKKMEYKTGMYYQQRDYPIKASSTMDNEELIRYACRDLLAALGTQMKFSSNGVEMPGTSMTEIKHRLVLD